MRLFPFFVIVILFFSCVNKERKPLIAIDKFKLQVPKDTGVSYFQMNSPSIVLSGNQQEREEGHYVKKWASETLFCLGEPVLYNYSGEGECIRLVWLRSFGNPIVIRLNNFNDTVSANIKELKSKSSENDIPEIVMDTIAMFDVKKWEQALSELQENNYWNAKYRDASLESKDGIGWFLECRLRNRYHCIKRWDDGSLSSKDLNLYANELINIASSYTSMKSSK